MSKITVNAPKEQDEDLAALAQLLLGAGEDLYLAELEYGRQGRPFPPELLAARAAIRAERERLEGEVAREQVDALFRV